ncbi:hypothetical protein COT70_00765 [candidate division WWE3 bacterium CG09_land_8_20_14_0_10_47_33]|nr:MAG: hypothetical protein COT70_00765 [candidate division WWE3 bacterium CG09_land_8_20_14_0_10_47_33]
MGAKPAQAIKRSKINSMDKNRLLAYLAMLLTVAIWGVAGPVIKVTLRDIQPFTFLALRFFINTIVISPILYLYLKTRPPDPPTPRLRWASLPRLFFLTLLGTTSTLALIFLGMDRTSALDATLISATAPLFIVIGGSLVCIKGVVCLKETVTQWEKIGLTIALAGVGITILQPFLEQGIFAKGNLLGNLLVFASNFTWAAFTLFAKEDFRRYTPFLITASSFIFGFFTFLPLALLENPNLLVTIYHLPLTARLGVLYMSLFSSVVAYFTYAWGVEKIEASKAALFLYLQPLFAAPFAYLWLGEKVTPAFIFGAAVIATGVVLTESRPRIASLKNR